MAAWSNHLGESVFKCVFLITSTRNAFWEQGWGSGKFIFKVPGVANAPDLKTTVHTNWFRVLNPTCIYLLTGVRPVYVT